MYAHVSMCGRLVRYMLASQCLQCDPCSHPCLWIFPNSLHCTEINVRQTVRSRSLSCQVPQTLKQVHIRLSDSFQDLHPPPRADTPPPGADPPRKQRRLLLRTVRILLECILVGKYVLRGPPPHSRPNFLYFHVVGRIIGWRSPLGLAPPRLGNSGSAIEIKCLTSKPCAATVSGLQKFRRPHQRQ